MRSDSTEILDLENELRSLFENKPALFEAAKEALNEVLENSKTKKIIDVVLELVQYVPQIVLDYGVCTTRGQYPILTKVIGSQQTDFWYGLFPFAAAMLMLFSDQWKFSKDDLRESEALADILQGFREQWLSQLDRIPAENQAARNSLVEEIRTSALAAFASAKKTCSESLRSNIEKLLDQLSALSGNDIKALAELPETDPTALPKFKNIAEICSTKGNKQAFFDAISSIPLNILKKIIESYYAAPKTEDYALFKEALLPGILKILFTAEKLLDQLSTLSGDNIRGIPELSGNDIRALPGIPETDLTALPKFDTIGDKQAFFDLFSPLPIDILQKIIMSYYATPKTEDYALFKEILLPGILKTLLIDELSNLLDDQEDLFQEVAALLKAAEVSSENALRAYFLEIAASHQEILVALADLPSLDNHPILAKMTPMCKAPEDFLLLPLGLAKYKLKKIPVGKGNGEFRSPITKWLWIQEISSIRVQLKEDLGKYLPKKKDPNPDVQQEAVEEAQAATTFALLQLERVSHFESDSTYYLSSLSQAEKMVLGQNMAEGRLKQNLLANIDAVFKAQTKVIEEALTAQPVGSTALPEPVIRARNIAFSFLEMIHAICIPTGMQQKLDNLRVDFYCLFDTKPLLKGNPELLAQINYLITNGSEKYLRTVVDHLNKAETTTLGLLQLDLLFLLHQKNFRLLEPINATLLEAPAEIKNDKKALLNLVFMNHPELVFALLEANKNQFQDLREFAREFCYKDGISVGVLTQEEMCLAPLSAAKKLIKETPGIFGANPEELTQAFDALSSQLKSKVLRNSKKIEDAKKIAVEHFKMIKVFSQPAAPNATAAQIAETRRNASETCLENCTRISLGKTVLKIIARIADYLSRLLFVPFLFDGVRDKMGLNASLRSLNPAYSKAGIFVSKRSNEAVKKVGASIQAILAPKA